MSLTCQWGQQKRTYVLGTYRAGENKVIVPWVNRRDAPKEVRMRTVREPEALDAEFGEGTLPCLSLTSVVERRP